jgi:hypothetical protein
LNGLIQECCFNARASRRMEYSAQAHPGCGGISRLEDESPVVHGVRAEQRRALPFAGMDGKHSRPSFGRFHSCSPADDSELRSGAFDRDRFRS